MTELLLETKTYLPPLRPLLVPRPQLIARLNKSLSTALTLISAPAGYGKTTLMAEWLHHLVGRGRGPEIDPDSAAAGSTLISWLSLDEGDNDPARFLAYTAAALGGADERLGRSMRPLLRSPQPPSAETVVTALINELAAVPDPVVFVLDDYHAIHNPAIHELLAFFLDHLPPRVHLVILTREDPLLPVARLRARGQLQEIRQDDLRFSIAEITQFLKVTMRLDLTAQDIAALEKRTEGWIAGLQLAALSMKGHRDLSGFVQAFTGSNRFILDYLIEEVFEQQSPDVQEFLTKTAILERLCAPLCDAVVDKPVGDHLLDSLERANLFIVPLDQSRTWYRYHRLFADLTRHRLRLSHGEQEADLHLRASRWFEKENLPAEAIHHALAGHHWERAAQLTGQVAERMLRRGELVTLIDWFQQIPKPIILSQPPLGLSFVWALLLVGHIEAAEALLSHFEEMGRAVPVLLGQVATAQAYAARARGDNMRVIEKSEQALGLLPEEEVISRSTLYLNLGLVYWHEGRLFEAEPALQEAQALAIKTRNHYGALTTQIFQARIKASQGSLRQAEKILHEALQAGGQIPILALAHYDLATIYWERHDLERAWTHLEAGLKESRRSRNDEFLNAGHIIKACLLAGEGNLKDAAAEADASLHLAQQFNPETRARSRACQAYVALKKDEPAAAKALIEEMAVDVDINSFYRFLGLMKARYLLATRQKEAARELLVAYQDQARGAGWGYAAAAVNTLRVLAAETAEQALEILAETLTKSQPEGLIRTFVDAGPNLIPLLQEAARRGSEPAYVGQILTAFGDHDQTTGPLVEALSHRELEVLRLVTAGLSNREIAAQLYISPGTAKTHVHNLCGKLGARNRTEAATRALELGLV